MVIGRFYLTLTSVVFEFLFYALFYGIYCNLTLTSVVFEFKGFN